MRVYHMARLEKKTQYIIYHDDDNRLGTVGDSFEKAGKADAGITLEYVRQWMRNNRTASRFDKVWASVHSAPTRMHSAGHSEPPKESNTNRFATTINHASGKLRKTLADVLHKIAIVVNFNIYIYMVAPPPKPMFSTKILVFTVFHAHFGL